MSAPALRPLQVGEILDAGIKVYVKNVRTLMGLTAVVVVPLQVVSAIVLLSIVSNSHEVPRGFLAAGTVQTSSERFTSLGASTTLGILGGLASLLTTAACVKAVSDIYLDQPTDIRSSLRFALRRLGSLLWLEIFLGVLLLLAFVALVIPGIWLYAAASVATPALLIEGRRGSRAVGRSLKLVRGRWWPTAGVLLVAAVMVSVVSGAIQALLVGILLTGSGDAVVLTVLVVSLAAAASAILTRPFQAAVTTVLYYDLRVRHEGYDVALLAEQLGIEPAALPPAWPRMPGPRPWERPADPRSGRHRRAGEPHRRQRPAVTGSSALAGGDAASARLQARAILAERRFHVAAIPRPLHGVLHALGKAIDAPLQALGELVPSLSGSVPGGSAVVWGALAALVLAAGATLATRRARRALREESGVGPGARQAPVRAVDLERAALQAEREGRHSEAVRLRFRAGLAALAESELVAFVPSMSNAEVSRALRSERFDDLARRFEEIVYGGRAAVEEDVRAARLQWSRVLKSRTSGSG